MLSPWLVRSGLTRGCAEPFRGRSRPRDCAGLVLAWPGRYAPRLHPLDRLRTLRRMGRAMSMRHGGVWRSTLARGKEGAPRRVAASLTANRLCAGLRRSPSPSTRLGQQLQGGASSLARSPARGLALFCEIKICQRQPSFATPAPLGVGRGVGASPVPRPPCLRARFGLVKGAMASRLVSHLRRAVVGGRAPRARPLSPTCYRARSGAPGSWPDGDFESVGRRFGPCRAYHPCRPPGRA